MKTMQIHSQVGADGVLDIRVPLATEDAASRVLITIQPIPAEAADDDRAEWHRFVSETYGSCAGFGLERQDQGELQERDPIE